MFLEDLYELDVATMTWRNITAAAAGLGPSAGAFRGVTVAGKNVYTFGGMDSSSEAISFRAPFIFVHCWALQ